MKINLQDFEYKDNYLSSYETYLANHEDERREQLEKTAPEDLDTLLADYYSDTSKYLVDNGKVYTVDENGMATQELENAITDTEFLRQQYITKHLDKLTEEEIQKIQSENDAVAKTISNKTRLNVDQSESLASELYSLKNGGEFNLSSTGLSQEQLNKID